MNILKFYLAGAEERFPVLAATADEVREWCGPSSEHVALVEGTGEPGGAATYVCVCAQMGTLRRCVSALGVRVARFPTYLDSGIPHFTVSRPIGEVAQTLV